ncbi:unnamed protein product [Rangifer tarandus platyrhynchus]|uniref:Uncharacterized protein n=1 Tax=Rangifer tarandus platyrhynchus TaxID=3082113 RepID=A0ABN8ZFZ8_RANTA|nr:unnamed protein product [Rangifer tarandus platyrhynchus]
MDAASLSPPEPLTDSRVGNRAVGNVIVTPAILGTGSRLTVGLELHFSVGPRWPRPGWGAIQQSACPEVTHPHNKPRTEAAGEETHAHQEEDTPVEPGRALCGWTRRTGSPGACDRAHVLRPSAHHVLRGRTPRSGAESHSDVPELLRAFSKCESVLATSGPLLCTTSLVLHADRVCLEGNRDGAGSSGSEGEQQAASAGFSAHRELMLPPGFLASGVFPLCLFHQLRSSRALPSPPVTHLSSFLLC